MLQSRKIFKIELIILKNSSDYIIPEYSNNLAYISKQINKHLSNEEKKQIDASILYLEKFYSEIYDLLPIFYKYTEVPM